MGDDGADRLNEQQLFQVAKQNGVPVLDSLAYHAIPEREKSSRPDQMDDDDFRGLASSLELCDGSRVLLMQNLWVEAGLMNGAMGTVRGFVWPTGGGPECAREKVAGSCVRDCRV